ncbi:MAG: WD40 repeat domain-containing protein [Anaerolineae bacterium]|nr:WD40 repeat domain-containing protein [Anaerolineae bacterium]
MDRLILVAVLFFVLPLPISVTLARQPANPDAIEAIAWSPDGSRIASGHTDGSIKIWNARDHQLIRTLEGHSDAVLSLNWHRNNLQLVSGSWDDTVRIWNTSNGRMLATLSGLRGGIGWVGWHPDGNEIYVFTYTQGKNLHIFDSSTYQLTAELDGGSIAQVAWHPDMTQIAVASVSGYTEVWDAETLQPLYHSPDAYDFEPYGVYIVAWSPDGNLVASGTSDGWVRLWHPALGQITFALRGTDSQRDEWSISEIQTVFFSPDGNSVSSISADGTFRTWNTSTGTTLETVQLLNFPVYAASLSPDGTQIAYGGEEGILQLIPRPIPPN